MGKSRNTFSLAGFLLAGFLLSIGTSTAQVRSPVLATGLCNTGLVPRHAQPQGCTTSVPVTPVNPVDGGSSVDGNWSLATPYPSAQAESIAPNPCTLVTAYGPAWVNAAWPSWFNPNDGFSQWIEPLGGGYAAAGWYVYRTSFPVPAAYPGYTRYVLEVNGQVLSDNNEVGIYVQDPANLGSTCREIASIPGSQFTSWTSFHVATPVDPGTRGYIYVVLLNATGGVGGNPTGLRIEWNTPYFFPY